MPSDHAYSRLSMSMPAGALRALGKLNVPVYRHDARAADGQGRPRPGPALTSTGRRSGQPRTAPVLYLADGDRVIVIGSNAGNARAPAWSHNLKANPDAEVEIGGVRRLLRARVAEGDERVELWRKMNEQYAGFEDYDERTSREIAVFVLEPR